MRLVSRVLVLLAVPSVAFAWLSRVPSIVTPAPSDFLMVDEPWLDLLAALAVAAVAVLIAGIIVGVLLALDFGSAPLSGRRSKR
jgi:hypothetical protein